MRKVRIGFVGVGNISGIYLENLTKEFREVEIIGVCDLLRERAEKAIVTCAAEAYVEGELALSCEITLALR